MPKKWSIRLLQAASASQHFVQYARKQLKKTSSCLLRYIVKRRFTKPISIHRQNRYQFMVAALLKTSHFRASLPGRRYKYPVLYIHLIRTSVLFRIRKPFINIYNEKSVIFNRHFSGMLTIRFWKENFMCWSITRTLKSLVPKIC